MSKFSKKISQLAFLFALVFSLSACVYSVQKIQPYSTISFPVSTAQIEKAILETCVSIGWEPSRIAPNTIQARIVVRGKHVVVVNIPYTRDHFSIEYVSSNNMDEKADGTIHPNYNKWVDNLSTKISQRIALIAID